LIKTRQFNDALLYIRSNNLANFEFEEAYILHRMAQNEEALEKSKQILTD